MKVGVAFSLASLTGACFVALANGLTFLFTHAPVDRSHEQSLLLLAIAFGILAREEKP